MDGLDGLARRVEDVKYPGKESISVNSLELFIDGCIYS